MSLYRMIFFGAAAFLAGVAIFMGAVMMITSLQNGAVVLSYSSAGKNITETISLAADSARFWKLFTAMGVAPAVLGAAAMWYSVRKLRVQA